MLLKNSELYWDLEMHTVNQTIKKFTKNHEQRLVKHDDITDTLCCAKFISQYPFRYDYLLTRQESSRNIKSDILNALKVSSKQIHL